MKNKIFGVLIVSAMVLLMLIGCFGCMTPKKATDYLKKKEKLAEICATEYPVKDSVIIKDSISTDTIYVGGEYVFDTIVVNDTVRITKTLPPTVVTKTITKTKEVVRENTARVDYLTNIVKSKDVKIGILEEKLSEMTAMRDSWKKKAKDRWYILWIVVILSIGWTFRKQIVKLI